MINFRLIDRIMKELDSEKASCITRRQLLLILVDNYFIYDSKK